MADYNLVETNSLTKENDAPPPSSVAVSDTLPRSDQSEEGGVVSSGSRPNRKAVIEAQEQASMNQQQSSTSVTEAHIQNEPQKSVCTTTSRVICSYSAAQPISCVPHITLPEQRPSSPKAVSVSTTEVDQQNSCGVKTKIAAPTVKTPVSDGYNWRKYGQKQVKSPIGSRSYYRCTHSDCSAKKVEFCDHSGHIIEVVSKGEHSHDPPLKANSTRESRRLTSAVKNKAMEHPIRMLSHQEISPHSSESTPEILKIDKKQQKPGGASGDGNENNTKDEDNNEPELKRAKKSNVGYSGPLLKPTKKSKLVVHAAGDVGISGDGHRWRKYGQKMVKGNPHPRNYYRCTSAGCPVRKHIETAVDNTNAVIITYKGVHDHDMPVPKKRHGLPSAPLVAASAPASMNNLQLKKSDSCANQISSTQWSVDHEGELSGEALDLGGEKAMESARTLLSIGIEIKPC